LINIPEFHESVPLKREVASPVNRLSLIILAPVPLDTSIPRALVGPPGTVTVPILSIMLF